MNKLTKGLLVWCTLGLFAPMASAKTIEYKWEGQGGVYLAGSFSFLSGLSGVIDEDDLSSFSMEVVDPLDWLLYGGGTLGSWSKSDGVSAGSSAFNFNFNVDTNQFIYGGAYDTDPLHISWGDTTSGWALVGGDTANGLILDGFDIPDPFFPTDFDFLFTEVSVQDAGQFSVTAEIPAPAPLALLSIGLLGLALVRRRNA